jgi:PTH1 family peptidyl-tRNA hydrolase
VKLFLLGLGNPGAKYSYNRHNIGHLFVDYYSSLYRSKFKKKSDFLVSQFLHSEINIVLLKSTTYMNHNGIGLSKFLRNNLHPDDRFLVVHDEIHLPHGKVKLSLGKSAGGHNGVTNVMNELGFSPLRLRIGINNAENLSERMTDFVLGNFTLAEKDSNKLLFPKLVHALQLLCDRGLSVATNYINRYPIPTPS